MTCLLPWPYLNRTSPELSLHGRVGFGRLGHWFCNERITDINLSELQKTLDAQGIELVENQKESVVGRKALADRTKGAPHLVLNGPSEAKRIFM